MSVTSGFSAPTKRVEILKEQILTATPCIETERALLITESYKQTESLPPIIRRAKALEKLLNEVPIIIRDEELIVGSLTKTSPRSSQVFPEFSNKWLKDEFDRIGKRNGDSFQISETAKRELEEVFAYWNDKNDERAGNLLYVQRDTRLHGCCCLYRRQLLFHMGLDTFLSIMPKY